MPKPHIKVGIIGASAGLSVAERLALRGALSTAAPVAQSAPCPYCGGTCAPGDCAFVFTPIIDCSFKDADDGCCRHPANTTPECHTGACPRLHRRLKT